MAVSASDAPAGKARSIGAPTLDSPQMALAITGFGLLLRLVYLSRLVHQPLSSDAASYQNMAAALAAGRHFVPFWPPGVPLYLASVERLLGTSTLAERGCMLAFYLLTSVVLYQATLLVVRKAWAANVALLLLAISPGMVCLSLEPSTELPAAMLLSLIALCVLRASPRDTRFLAVSLGALLGVALGCLGLVRPSSLALLAIASPLMVWCQRRVAPALLALAVPLVMVFVWVSYVHQTTGSWVWINTANAKNLYIGNCPQTPLYRTWWLGSHHEQDGTVLDRQLEADNPIAAQQEYSRRASRAITQHPGLFLLRTFNRVCVFFAVDTFPGAYLTENYHFPRSAGLAVIGLDALLYFAMIAGSLFYIAILHGGEEHARQMGMLCVLAFVYAAPYFVAFSHPRYRMPLLPLLMISFAAFLVRMVDAGWQPFHGISRGRRLAVISALVIFLVVQLEFVCIVARARA
jgi:hypothetical protein